MNQHEASSKNNNEYNINYFILTFGTRNETQNPSIENFSPTWWSKPTRNLAMKHMNSNQIRQRLMKKNSKTFHKRNEKE